ncbi:hypothetical protein AMTR_s00011p00096960 [Amborella trichopoda]|uniref:Uncharacterized protein n=1 Tax=Amborella trichopoda TaxID=13333 RepID=W1NGI3_AMBTC|nr:hypothetical protein AMTR_s00011p00096960 [Amborella trichopoda]
MGAAEYGERGKTEGWTENARVREDRNCGQQRGSCRERRQQMGGNSLGADGRGKRRTQQLKRCEIGCWSGRVVVVDGVAATARMRRLWE